MEVINSIIGKILTTVEHLTYEIENKKAHEASNRKYLTNPLESMRNTFYPCTS